MSAKNEDENGYVTIARNPITRAGVFQYMGETLPDGEPGKVYGVYRPLEELTRPETIESFKGLPIVNDHEMLGEGYERGAEERGVHGSILESIEVVGRDVLAPLRIFSRALKSLIDSGKKGLSLGYRCRFEKSAGVFEGMRYDYIQRDIRGNHLALVNEGRCGTAVLDHHWAFDSFDLALEKQEKEMTDENKSENSEMTLAEVTAAIRMIMPLVEELKKLQDGKKDETLALDKKEGEDVCDEDEKKKESADENEEAVEDEKEDEKKEKEAMDSAEIKGRLSALEQQASIKALRAQIAATESLARRVAQHVGTFDYSAMDEADVVAYSLEKLNLTAPKGQERATLDGYLKGVEANSAAVAYAMDTKPALKAGGLLEETLKKRASI